MYSDENKSSVLAKFINNFDYVIIDTCSLMDDAFPEWMDALHGAKAYRKKELEIIVPRRCFDELKKHARQKENDSRRIDAKRGLKIVRRAKWSKLLTITKKDGNENFADNWIYVKVSTDRLFSKILIITQDKSLAYDLRQLNQLKSQNGRPIEVSKIVSGGRLVPNFGEASQHKEHRGQGPLVKDGPKTTPNKGKPQEPNPAEAVLLADARLSAVINNPTYPDEKKRQDALTQLKAIEKLPDSVRSRLDLLVPVYRLQDIAKPQKKVEAKKETPKPEPKKEEPKKPEPKTETVEPTKERLWYGTGATMAEGFKQCGEHYGLIFREPTLVYAPAVHGALDWTTKDLDNIEILGTSLLKGEEKISFLYRGVTLMTQKCPTKFKCWIDVNALPNPLLPLGKNDLPKLPKEEKPAEPAPTETPVAEEKPKATRKKAAKPKAEAPEEPKAETPAEAKPKKAAPKARKAAEPKEEPATEKPATPKKTKKAVEPAPAEEAVEPAVKKPAKKAKTAQKPAEKTVEAEPKPKQTRKKPAAKAEEKPNDELYQKVIVAERRLRAVLPNPNYPPENKAADLNAYRELISGLSQEQMATLKLGPTQIEEWLKKIA